jgi:hypothetical protein
MANQRAGVAAGSTHVFLLLLNTTSPLDGRSIGKLVLAPLQKKAGRARWRHVRRGRETETVGGKIG